MTEISVAEVIKGVRKNLDEIGLNESVMYNTEDTDNDSLDKTIKMTIAQAINEVHLAAPSYMLEGVSFRSSGLDYSEFDDGVLTFSFHEPFLRLVAMKAMDSRIVITDLIPEASAQGREQLNRYVRGTYQRPVLVMAAGRSAYPEFRYYSLKDGSFADNPEGAIDRFEYIPKQTFSEGATEYLISPDLRMAVLDYLTGMVLAIFGEGDKAKYFFDKAKLS